MSTGGFENLQHFPRNVEDHANVQDYVAAQGCMRVQERPEKSLVLPTG